MTCNIYKKILHHLLLNLLQILNLYPLLFCALYLFWAAPDLKNSPKIKIKTYQLNNYYLLCEDIYFPISVLFLMLSQSNNFINNFFYFTRR